MAMFNNQMVHIMARWIFSCTRNGFFVYKNLWKDPACSMGKSTQWGMFNSYVKLPEGIRYMAMDQYLLIPFLGG